MVQGGDDGGGVVRASGGTAMSASVKLEGVNNGKGGRLFDTFVAGAGSGIGVGGCEVDADCGVAAVSVTAGGNVNPASSSMIRSVECTGTVGLEKCKKLDVAIDAWSISNCGVSSSDNFAKAKGSPAAEGVAGKRAVVSATPGVTGPAFGIPKGNCSG